MAVAVSVRLAGTVGNLRFRPFRRGRLFGWSANTAGCPLGLMPAPGPKAKPARAMKWSDYRGRPEVAGSPSERRF